MLMFGRKKTDSTTDEYKKGFDLCQVVVLMSRAIGGVGVPGRRRQDCGESNAWSNAVVRIEEVGCSSNQGGESESRWCGQMSEGAMEEWCRKIRRAEGWVEDWAG